MNSILKSFSIVTAFSVATRFLSFLFKIWMSRALGAEVVGLYQISFSVLIMLFSLAAGAPTVLSRKVAEAQANGDIRRQNALTTAMLILGFSVSSILILIVFLFKSKLGVVFADERCIPLFLVMLPTLLSSALYAPLRSWLWGRKRFLAFSATELFDEVARIIIAAIFVCLIPQIDKALGVSLALTISDYASVLLLFIIFFISGGRFAKPKGAKELIKGAVPLTAVRIITSISASITALIIPERLVAFGMDIGTATAEYGRVSGMALPLIMAPVSLISSLSVVLIPDIASLYAKRDYKEIKQKLGMVITFSAVIASLFFALYLPLGKELGKLFFGDETAGKFVSYCSALIFPIAFAQATTPMLNSLGMETKTLISYLIGLCFTLPCVFFLPKFIGVYSMAVGSGLGFLATGIFNLVCLSKKLSGIKEINLKKAGITVAFSIPLAVLGVLGFRLLSPYLEWFASFITGFYVVFLFIIFASAFDIVDIQGFLVSLKRTQTLKSRKKHRLNGKIKA